MPSVKGAIKITITFGVAVVIGLLMTIAKGIMTNTLRVLPCLTYLTPQCLTQGLWHMIDCPDCIPVLVGKLTVLLCYFGGMCFIIGSTNRIQRINIEGFFNTCGVALLIVIGQKIIYWILPWV